jgi:hypothetical protein
MKTLNAFLFTTLITSAKTSLQPTKRICKDCRHFIANDLQCRKFGHTDIVTGKLTYEYARLVRIDDKKCGDKAIHFEENRFKIVTVPYYFFKDKWPLFLVVSLICSSASFNYFMPK